MLAHMKPLFACLAGMLLVLPLGAGEPGLLTPPSDSPTPADEALANYFRNEADLLASRCLAEVRTAEDWTARRAVYREQLQEMLGLKPWPSRTDLKATVTGKLEEAEFTVEKLHFQPVPHLYITAALYVPKKREGRLPAILLESGHARFITNNISYGNKAVYQGIAAWFARNGYVCLNVDTLSLGEIRGDHLGTRDMGQWWWNARGYTPAGVEAWTGIRALDYLCSRPEVDSDRIGITGHSGGGAYSWTVGALDDRVKVAAAMAGLTDVQSQVGNNLCDGHCDCNFFINTYRWDFPQMAALLAPRPLIIGTTDKDRLFPIPGVSRLHQQVARIYKLLGETNNLGLVITPGPHEWNPEGQVAVLRWFNRHLKKEELPVETVAKPFFAPQQLKVFEELPSDAINTNVQKSFVPLAKPLPAAEVKAHRDELVNLLREKCFAGWPSGDLPLNAQRIFLVERDGLKFSAWDFESQHDVGLRLYFLESAASKPAESVRLEVLDEAAWSAWLSGIKVGFENSLKEELSTRNSVTANQSTFDKWRDEVKSGSVALGFFAPRGIGLNAWSGSEKRLTQIRRRFMLLGQTLDGMRVWDIRRAIQTVHFVREGDKAHVELKASAAMSNNARLAALFEPTVRKVDANTWRDASDGGEDYLSNSKLMDASTFNELFQLSSEPR